MPSGILGQSALSANTNTTVYTVPSAKLSTFNVNILNRSTTTVYVNLAISATGSPSDSELIEFNAAVPSRGILERTGLVAEAGKKVVVFATTANVSVSVYGFEE